MLKLEKNLEMQVVSSCGNPQTEENWLLEMLADFEDHRE